MNCKGERSKCSELFYLNTLMSIFPQLSFCGIYPRRTRCEGKEAKFPLEKGFQCSTEKFLSLIPTSFIVTVLLSFHIYRWTV